jgi:hypothetical protein
LMIWAKEGDYCSACSVDGLDLTAKEIKLLPLLNIWLTKSLIEFLQKDNMVLIWECFRMVEKGINIEIMQLLNFWHVFCFLGTPPHFSQLKSHTNFHLKNFGVSVVIFCHDTHVF